MLSGDATATAKDRTGAIEAIRVLRITRSSAVAARTVVANQLNSLIITAPSDLHDQLAPLTPTRRRRAITAMTAPAMTATSATSGALITALRALVARHDNLNAEIKLLDKHLRRLVTDTAPRTLESFGVGVETAGQLLCTIGANPQRFTSAAAFAALCGASPVDASSGRNDRHRLNRGGDRRANCALWAIVFTRSGRDERTKAYIAKRLAEGKTRKEAIRCLKTYLARELYKTLRADLTQPALT